MDDYLLSLVIYVCEGTEIYIISLALFISFHFNRCLDCIKQYSNSNRYYRDTGRKREREFSFIWHIARFVNNTHITY